MKDPANAHIVAKSKAVGPPPPRTGPYTDMPGRTEEEMFDRGKVLFTELTGKDVSNLSHGKSGFNDMTFGNLFGGIWCRDGLSLHERSLMVCCIGATCVYSHMLPHAG